MIRALTSNGTHVYHLSGGKTIPEFIKESKGNASLRKNQEYRKRLELIQDFDFPVSCGRVRVSPDGQFIGAVGVYPPEVRLFDTAQLSMKFQRRLDCEITDFRFLSEDYRKLVFLMADRSLEFHAQGGRHHKLRIPKPARRLEYIEDNATLLAVGSSSEVFRLDLEAGEFLQPLQTEHTNLTCCAVSPSLPIFCVGGDGENVQVFDHRHWKAVASFGAVLEYDDVENGKFVSALDFSSDGRYVCAGTSAGICRIFDIRSSRPLASKDHRNLFPIVDLQIVERAKLLDGALSDAEVTVVSADRSGVKIWSMGREEDFVMGNTERGTALLASLEPDVPREVEKLRLDKCAGAINSLAVYPQSGLIFVGQDNPRIGVYFVPRLGIAPRWCSFLDSLTEEVEVSASDETVYEDFQFVTKPQLKELGADHLIGTALLRYKKVTGSASTTGRSPVRGTQTQGPVNHHILKSVVHVVRAYMHGYFMDARLYQKLKAVSQPFAVEEFRKQKLKEKIESHRKMRIQVKRKLPPVNQELAARLQEKAQAANPKVAAAANNILTDERFAELFTSPGFAIETVPLDKHNSQMPKEIATAVEVLPHGFIPKKKRRKV